METDKELQQSYLQLQMIDSQMQEFEKELASLEVKKRELENIKKGLDELKKSRNNSKILAQIGGEIYAESEIKDAKELIVHVGARTFVRKNIDELKKLLEKQSEQISLVAANLMQNMQILGMRGGMLQKQMQEKLLKK